MLYPAAFTAAVGTLLFLIASAISSFDLGVTFSQSFITLLQCSLASPPSSNVPVTAPVLLFVHAPVSGLYVQSPSFITPFPPGLPLVVVVVEPPVGIVAAASAAAAFSAAVLEPPPAAASLAALEPPPPAAASAAAAFSAAVEEAGEPPPAAVAAALSAAVAVLGGTSYLEI